jgi:hypothetical protein
MEAVSDEAAEKEISIPVNNQKSLQHSLEESALLLLIESLSAGESPSLSLDTLD